MRYFRRLLGNGRYKFRTDGPGTLKDKLLDLFLSAVPYPAEEYDRENPPPWKLLTLVPWARTRHRMDALYEHTFDPRHLSDAVLEHIDDQFGPINIDTIAQILHIARKKVITTTEGKNIFVSGGNLQALWPKQGTLHIYNADNKMVSQSTQELTRQWMDSNGVPFSSVCLPGMAHQDGVIGKDRNKTFTAVQDFLELPPHLPFIGPLAQNCLLQAPWTGPRITHGMPVRILVGGDPGNARSKALVLPVQRVNGALVLMQPLPATLNADFVFSTTSGQRRSLLSTGARGRGTKRNFQAAVDVSGQIAQFAGLTAGLEGYVVLVCVPISGYALVDSATITTLFARLSQELLQSCFLHKAAVTPATAIPAPPARFVVVSCKYPNGVFDVVPASWALQEIERQRAVGNVREMLMLGDQIYADASAGLLDPSRMDDRYQRPYEDLYRIPALQSLMRSIPIRMMLDDHEIAENWERGGNNRENGWFEQGLYAYWRYQRMDAQRFTLPGSSRKPVHGAYKVCGFPLYMADTRTERTMRNAQTPNATIMSDTQMRAIRKWMFDNQAKNMEKQTPIFVACPAMILPRPLALRDHPNDRLLSDSWSGYPASMHEILGYMAAHRIGGVVFLSGDEHLGNFAEFTLSDAAGKELTKGYSIHVPGLYAPIPFANAIPEKFAANETFPVIYLGVQYQCKVNSAATAPGNGFVSIEVSPTIAGFSVIATTYHVDGCGLASVAAQNTFPIYSPGN
jgi:cholesterol oxidase